MTETPAVSTANDSVVVPAPSVATPNAEQQPRTLASAEILQGERKVLITHGNETYRLLVTRNDKLILQK
jgi:hemin uptake protein HemP